MGPHANPDSRPMYLYLMAVNGMTLASAADMINAVTSMLLVMGANMISRRASETSLY